MPTRVFASAIIADVKKLDTSQTKFQTSSEEGVSALDQKNSQRRTWYSIITVILILALAGGAWAILEFWPAPPDSPDDSKVVVISQNGVDIMVLPLDEDAHFTVEYVGVDIFGNEVRGTNTVIIHDNGVHVKDADCLDKICEGFGTITNVNDFIVCMPHRLVIEIVLASSLPK